MFRNGFPIELENILNNHYGVWFHLTIMSRQLEELKTRAHTVVDIGDPFFHLATVSELVERTFVFAHITIRKSQDKPAIKKLTKQQLSDEINDFMMEYDQVFAEWEEKLKPVSLRIHGFSEEFKRCVETENKTRRKFIAVSDKIKRYRNIAAHSLPPLRLIDKETGKICIPNEKALSKYDKGHWTSDRAKYDPQDFEFAEEIIEDLANRLIEQINDLWVDLLTMMAAIASSDTYKEWFSPKIVAWYGEIFNLGSEIDWTESLESGQYHLYEQNSANTPHPYTWGTIEFRPDNRPWNPPPPDKPSAYT